MMMPIAVQNSIKCESGALLTPNSIISPSYSMYDTHYSCNNSSTGSDEQLYKHASDSESLYCDFFIDTPDSLFEYSQHNNSNITTDDANYFRFEPEAIAKFTQQQDSYENIYGANTCNDFYNNYEADSGSLDSPLVLDPWVSTFKFMDTSTTQPIKHEIPSCENSPLPKFKTLQELTTKSRTNTKDYDNAVPDYSTIIDNFDVTYLGLDTDTLGHQSPTQTVPQNSVPTTTTREVQIAVRNKCTKKKLYEEVDESEMEEKIDCNKKYLCKWKNCYDSFPTLNLFVKHIERKHIEGNRKGDEFTCYWNNCVRKESPFNARYKLLIHMRVHTGEKPNKCPHPGCDKAFSRLENLKIHTRSHTGERPYACQYLGCLKAFSNSSDRAKHQRTHYDTKPYACQLPGCSKRYTDPSSLRKHVKNHAIKSTFAGRRKTHRDTISKPKQQSITRQHFSESDIYTPATSFNDTLTDDVFVPNNVTVEKDYEEITHIMEIIDNTDGSFGNVDDNGFYEDNSEEFISYDCLKKFIDASDLNDCEQYF